MTNTLESRVKDFGNHSFLSESDVRTIVDSYTTFHGNASETARQLKHNRLTITRYWNKEGLKAVGVISRRLPENEARKIVDSYTTFHGNASETARQLGHCEATIRRCWNKEGLKAIGHLTPKYRGFKTPLDCFRFYEKTDEEYRGLLRYGLFKKDSGLYRALIRHGQIDDAFPKGNIAGSGGRPSLSEKEIYRIAEVYIQIRHMGKTVEITGHSYPTVSKYLRSLGIEIKENRGRKRKRNLIPQ